ncbi:MAG: MarR family transcriptional regulator [Candidatus Campbellbacteria bacterium]|nr:MarR family transcriptional regulator [Candidatus Campbellbacteria bacterium]
MSSKNIKQHNSYDISLLQSKAYRMVKTKINEALEKSDISATDWAILGALESADEPLLFGELAESAGVTAPRITIVVNNLKNKGWVSIKMDSSDSRRKRVALSKKGKNFIKSTEKKVQSVIQDFFSDIPAKQTEYYFKVLEKISEKHI